MKLFFVLNLPIFMILCAWLFSALFSLVISFLLFLSLSVFICIDGVSALFYGTQLNKRLPPPMPVLADNSIILEFFLNANINFEIPLIRQYFPNCSVDLPYSDVDGCFFSSLIVFFLLFLCMIEFRFPIFAVDFSVFPFMAFTLCSSF